MLLQFFETIAITIFRTDNKGDFRLIDFKYVVCYRTKHNNLQTKKFVSCFLYLELYYLKIKTKFRRYIVIHLEL